MVATCPRRNSCIMHLKCVMYLKILFSLMQFFKKMASCIQGDPLKASVAFNLFQTPYILYNNRPVQYNRTIQLTAGNHAPDR